MSRNKYPNKNKRCCLGKAGGEVNIPLLSPPLPLSPSPTLPVNLNQQIRF